MIDTKAIRAKVLDLAIRGKLTEQLPEDGTAEELFQQIQEEKQSLIQAEKIKRAKPQPEIQADEVPIEVPAGWKWVRLESLYCFIDYRGATPSKTNSGVPFVTAKNVRKGYLDYSIKEYISEQDYSNRQSRGVSHKGDLLFTTEAPMGFAAIADLGKFSAGQRLITLQQYTQSNLLENRYYMYFILGRFFQTQLEAKCSGTTVKGIKADRLREFIIPLPPLPEQRRIVAKIDAIFSLLDTIDALQSAYTANQKALRAKLIDAAIRGQLTEQLPEDGTAEELYRQIQAERAKQEENGTIKKEEPLSEIDNQSAPFPVPNTWLWTHFGNVSYIVRGGSPRPIKQYITQDPDGINWIKIGDVEKGGKYIYQTNERIIPEGEKKSRRVYPGDFLLTNSMSFGRPYISKIEGCIHDGWLLIRNLGGFDPDFLYYLLSSTYLFNQFTISASGSTVDNLNIDKVRSAVIPLPPLAEQKRIVARLEELLAVCGG